MSNVENEIDHNDFNSLSETTRSIILMAGSGVFSLFLVFFLQLPIIGILPGILAFPIFILGPHLGTTKEDMELVFFILILKTPLAWGIFYAYYFIIFNLIALFFPYTFLKLIKKKYLTASVLLLTSIMTWFRFSWYYMGDKGLW